MENVELADKSGIDASLGEQFKVGEESINRLKKILIHFQPIVKAVLSIQMSSAESERLFSMAKWYVERREQLSMRTVNELIRVRSHYESICNDRFNEWPSIALEIAMRLARSIDEGK